MKRSVFLTGACVLILATIAMWTPRSQALPMETRSVSATCVHGVLRVLIPYDAPRTGEGTLLVEVLDPEDRAVASINRHADANTGHGLWNRELALPQNLPFDELVWHRLRYRFTYANEDVAPIEGVTSISRVLRLPVVHVLGRQSYLSGGAAAVRLIVNEADNEAPVTSGSVQIELLLPGHKNQVLFTGTLNERGTTPVRFQLPAGLVGQCSLRYAVDTALGPVEHVEDIRLEDKSSILLTTEKPIYQPGQTIHVRALTLDRANHQAVAGRQLTFELDDSRGNKVFRKITQTDQYGLASAEFALADEVNLGTYHLRAILANAAEAPTSSSEIPLQVDRYVLPRFKVAVELSGKDGRGKLGYRPGDHVTGTVRANYFFGKAVDGEVTVKVSGFDVARFDAGNSTGRTDAEGTFRFDIRLPDFFAGRPMNRGASRVVVEATVKDTSGHSESRGEPVTVSESPLLITVVPESGSLIPGLENRLYVLTSYPDGTPAEADIRVEVPGEAVRTSATDQGGIAIVSVPGGITNVQVRAKDREGNHASVRAGLESRAAASDQVLLRAEHAVYRPGEPIRLQIFSTRRSGSVYVDVIKEGQTIGTHDLNIANGQAGLELAATPDMTGTVEFHAYLFGANAAPIGDRRLVFVQPADELRIETSLDAPVYKPGGEARIGFRVTNNRGQGVQAALGVEIIDQAVFALAEKQPGFAKVFFYLEQEALKPHYEIHSVTLSDVVTSAQPADSNRRDRAAQALFAATQFGAAAASKTPSQFGGAVPQDKYQQFASRYVARLRAQIDQIASLEPSGKTHTCDYALLAAGLRKANFRDAWGNPLRVDTRGFAVRSAGPDGQFDTPDDLIQFRDERWCIVPPFRAAAGTFDLLIERSGDSETGIRGIVSDRSGAVIPGASIRVVERAAGKVHTLASSADGRFALSGFAAGDLEIQVSSPGFHTSVWRISLAEGDRAVFSAVLDVGSVADSVEVSAAAPMLNTMSTTVSLASKGSKRTTDASPASSPGTTSETHVRSWFPEALYVAPKIITDDHGRASITIPIADNITTWRMAMMASTKQGSLGSGTSNLKVFQDFFTELDLPVTLTQGDRVSIPVAVYNYSGTRGQVHLRLAPDEWFSLAGDTPEKSLAVENDRVGESQFTIEAKRIGKFKLTLKAESEGPARRADVVIREVEVVPNGREQTMAFNGRVEGSVEHAVTFPPDAIPDAGKIFVRLYPGPLSQVVEGMDAILRMPYGCFEQTSSATYPNVLALDYMQRTKKLTPEIHAKAEGFVANGYQRLLTFEVPGGGFSWFGRAPANKILTSYGLMEFADMARVHDVDARVIHRTQQWLAAQQQSDGSWKPDATFINEGATNRYNSDVLRITAYIAWALQISGYQGPEIERARQFLSRGLSGIQDAYTLAVLANFATAFQQDRAMTRQVVQQLVDAHTERDNQAWWTAEETAVYGQGASAAVETTGLVLQALLKSGEAPAVARKALNFIAARKDASGTWGTTQETIIALRALLLSMEKSTAEARGLVQITLNGKPAGRLTLTRENAGLFHQIVLKDIDFNGSNKVAIDFQGEGSPAYQVAGEYFVPWTAETSDEPLSIEVSYDRTRLSQGDFASAIATVKNHLSKAANVVMVDLGIPPGFELLTEDFDDYRNKSTGRKSGRLEKFNLTATHATLYFDSIAAGDSIALRYRLRAKFPIRSRTFQSRVYEYYNPEVASVARPVEMEIRKR